MYVSDLFWGSSCDNDVQYTSATIHANICHTSHTHKRTHLLDGVAKFATGKLVPETLNGSKVGGWDVLDLGPVNEVTSLLLGTGKNDQSIASELYKRNME